MEELTIDEVLDTLWTFNEERVYLLVAIARSKENESVRATDQPTMRKVVENREELDDKIVQLEHAAKRFPQEYRLYATVNGRNAWSAYTYLQNRMNEAREEARKSGEAPHLLKRIDHKWKSFLHSKESRDEKRFLWDVDEPSRQAGHEVLNELQEHTDVITATGSPNGWHIVTEPFNFNNLASLDSEAGTVAGFACERKPDDMVFLGFLEEEA